MPVSPSSAASFAAAPGQSTVSSAASAFPRSQHSAAPQHVPAVRVSVQDLEGDCERSCCLLVTGDIADLEGEVGSRFEYKSGNCVLWTRDGACVDDIALIRDDDRLFATDNTPFPQLLRELRTPGLRNVPLTAANGMPPSQQFQTWGWPRIGQLVGAETVRSKLLTGWLHTSAEASVLLLINMVAFLSPPTEVASEPPMPVLRMHFWFAGLGMVAALFALVLAVLLSMQLNLLPHEADVFWFLRAYGSWLFGWPTILLVLSLVSTSAQFVSSAALTYPTTDMSTDILGFLSLICVCSAVGGYLFLLTAKNCWARINGTSITKVWPGDPWIQTHSGPASPCQTGAR